MSRHFFSCLAILLFVTSCGWHLRGTQQSHIQLQEINLKFSQRNASLINISKRILDQKNIQHTENAKTAVTITREILDRRPLAYTETGIVAQYQLILTLEYFTNIETQSSKTINKVSATRNYDFDPVQISSETQEEEALLKEMRKELFTRILRIISLSLQQ